ncbi:unnamed protein product [Boreogadus saida]
MASAQVDLSEGCVGLTRDQFRRLTKEQLISLAGVEDIELAKDIRKPAIVAYLTRELNLEELWLEQQGQATLQTEKEERLATLQSERVEREAAYAHSERLVRLEVEKLAFTSVRGIDLLLGNDIAGTRVNPEVVDCPVYPVEMKEMEAEFPEVFTRAQAREKLAVGAPAPGVLSSPLVDEEPMVDLCDTVFPQWLTSGVLKGVREPISDIAAEIGTSQSLRSAEVTEVVLPSEVGGDDVAESDARGVVSRSEMCRAPEVSQPTFVQEQKEDPSLEETRTSAHQEPRYIFALWIKEITYLRHFLRQA